MTAFRFRSMLLLYVLLFAVLTGPCWLGGQVISPHRQVAEVGATASPLHTLVENRKFSDYTNGYVPELHDLLVGPRSGWIGLWTNENELGRPLSHLSGFSPAYLPGQVIAVFVDSPERFIVSGGLTTPLAAGYEVG